MQRAHKIRIYPNADQAKILRQHVGGVRFVYNWGLEHWKQWAEDKKNGVRDDNPNWIKLYHKWMTERPEWGISIPSDAMKYALKHLNTAYANHFKLGKGWPKFKKKGVRDAFKSASDKCTIRKDGTHVHIVGVKTDIRMAEELRFKGKINSYCVSVTGDKWYMSVQIETPDTRTAPDSTVGVDVGMKTPAVCSDGTTLTLPTEQLQCLDRRLRKAQRRYSRRQKGSRRRAKALRRKQRVQERINNIRGDAIHKFTSTVCKNHATVVIEDLNAAGMHHGPKNIRSGMQRSCMSEVLRQLSYKAINLVVADRWYPSTQLCSNCGARHKMELTERMYNCPHCGLSLDRDLNAAINLSKYPGSQG